MRICLVSGEFPPMQGGVGDYTQTLGGAMADAGHDVWVLTSAGAAGPTERQGCHIWPVMAHWGWDFWRTAAPLLKQAAPDVLHIQYQTAAYGMRPAVNVWPWRLRLSGRTRPLVAVTYHDLLVPYLFRGAGPLRRWVTELLARGADGAIATNEEDALRLRERLPRVRSRLIPIGSNILPGAPAGYDRQAWRSRWGIGETTFALAYFGFLNQSKGGEELIGALGRLVASGRDVKLLMVGGKVGASDATNRAYLETVERCIAGLGLEARVIWTDYLPAEEVTATLWAADACVLPYRDGVSTRRGTLMAALAHGRPLVTTRPAVPVDSFRDGQNMALVPPRDAAALAEAIGRLIDAPALQERLACGALELSRQFTWPAIAAQTLDFYAGLHR